MFAIAGSVLAALTVFAGPAAGRAAGQMAGRAAGAAGAIGGLWLLLTAGAAIRPAGLIALAAVTLTCLLLALLARGGQVAAAAGAFPQASRASALREKSWRAAFLPQRDPDAPGRVRPRAPGAGPAAA